MRWLRYGLALLLLPLVYGIAQIALSFWTHQPQLNDLDISDHRPDQFWWGFFYNRNNLPDVLLIGDSIAHGYRPFVVWPLRHEANVDIWVTPLGEHEPDTLPDLQKVLSFRHYDIIHFNTGLHGLELMPEQTLEHVQQYLQVIKQYAPHARLIWASITPLTVKGDKQTLDAQANALLIKKNALIAELMKENGVVINDLYTLMENNLQTATGDGTHWRIAGSRVMGDQIVSIIREQITPRGREAGNTTLYYFLTGALAAVLALLIAGSIKCRFYQQ